MKWVAVTFIFALFSSQVCGFVVHDSTQDLPINTIPKDATVIIGIQTCVTPCTLQV